mgnify:CR=1 FL=1
MSPPSARPGSCKMNDSGFSKLCDSVRFFFFVLLILFLADLLAGVNFMCFCKRLARLRRGVFCKQQLRRRLRRTWRSGRFSSTVLSCESSPTASECLPVPSHPPMQPFLHLLYARLFCFHHVLRNTYVLFCFHHLLRKTYVPNMTTLTTTTTTDVAVAVSATGFEAEAKGEAAATREASTAAAAAT